MEWKEVLERIEEGSIKDTVKALAEGKSFKEIGIEDQKALVKLRAPELLEVMREQTPFKAVRKEVRKALETLKAFGVVSGGEKKRARLGGWFDQPYGAAIKVPERFPGIWVGISIPEGGGYLPMVVLTYLDRYGIKEVAALSSDKEAREEVQRVWEESKGLKEVQVRTDQIAGLLLGILQQTPTGLRLNKKDAVLLDALLSQFYKEEDWLGQIEKEIQEASEQEGKDVEFPLFMGDYLLEAKIMGELREVLEAKTVVSEEQRERLLLDRFAKTFMEDLSRSKDWFKTYFTLVSYALYKAGDIRQARQYLDLKAGLDAPEVFDIFMIKGIRKMADEAIEAIKKDVEAKESKDEGEE